MKVPTLRPTELPDLVAVVAWERAPENASFILPWTPERHAEALKDADVRHLMVLVDSGPVGFVILTGVSGEAASIEFLRIVIDPKGSGLGRATVEVVKRLCFEELGAHRLWLDVKQHNERARSLYESCGFLEEGLLRDCLRTPDGYESLVVMSMLSREYVRRTG